MDVCVIGLWHQGIVGAACLADLGCSVVAADHDEGKVDRLNGGKAPLYEPGLDELIAAGLASGLLRFDRDVAGSVKGRPYVLLMFDTPVNDRDESDLSEVLATAGEIAPHLSDGVVLYVTAQVPVGTCDRIAADRPGGQSIAQVRDRVQPGEPPAGPGHRAVPQAALAGHRRRRPRDAGPARAAAGPPGRRLGGGWTCGPPR